MEYLPEKKRTQKSQVLKKEDKTRKFREYLANNDVVLSMVKCKLRSHHTHISFYPSLKCQIYHFLTFFPLCIRRYNKT